MGEPCWPWGTGSGKRGTRWDLSGHLPALEDLAWLPDDILAGNLLGQSLLSGVHRLPAHDDNLDWAENYSETNLSLEYSIKAKQNKIVGGQISLITMACRYCRAGRLVAWVGMDFSQLEMLPQQWEADCGSCCVKQNFRPGWKSSAQSTGNTQGQNSSLSYSSLGTSTELYEGTCELCVWDDQQQSLSIYQYDWRKPMSFIFLTGISL